MAIEWTTAARVAFQGTKQAYDNRHIIQKYWTKALAKFNKGSTDVVVTGHSAAGKSFLVAQLHGRARELFFEDPKESLKVEVEALTIGEWARLVRVLPGQPGRRVVGEMESIDTNRDLQGVIHVVDFGYVSPRDPAQAKSLLLRDGLDTIDKLREHNLKGEIRDLTLLIGSILKARSNFNRPNWLAIIVNKVDLFPHLLDETLAYYHPDGTGAFGKELSRLQGQLGSDSFGIYIVPACANETDFAWNDQTVKSALARDDQDKMLRELVKSLAHISEKHS